jgi:hypothetical protein
MKNITTKTRKELLAMTKTFQLIFSQITTNNKNIYHVIYDNLHKADATVFVFVDTDKSTLDFYSEAFKHFYDEPNIYFIGIEKDPSNITPELIDVAIEALNKSDLPLNDYKLKTFYMPKKDEKALSELKNAIDSLNCSDEDKLQLMKVMTGQL